MPLEHLECRCDGAKIFVVGCEISFPPISECGEGTQPLGSCCFSGQLFSVSVVRAFPLGRAVPGSPQHTTHSFRVSWAKSSKGKKNTTQK